MKLSDLSSKLSPRRMSLLLAVCDGLSNREVAQRLGLTVGTVKCYMQELMQFANCYSRLQLMRWALINGHYSLDTPEPRIDQETAMAFAALEFVELRRGKRTLAQCPGIESLGALCKQRREALE